MKKYIAVCRNTETNEKSLFTFESKHRLGTEDNRIDGNMARVKVFGKEYYNYHIENIIRD